MSCLQLSDQVPVAQEVEAPLKHSFPERFNQGFASELDAFADTLLLKKPWPVTSDDCVRVQKVADAARVSCELDQVVEVSYDDETNDGVLDAATSG